MAREATMKFIKEKLCQLFLFFKQSESAETVDKLQRNTEGWQDYEDHDSCLSSLNNADWICRECLDCDRSSYPYWCEHYKEFIAHCQWQCPWCR